MQVHLIAMSPKAKEILGQNSWPRVSTSAVKDITELDGGKKCLWKNTYIVADVITCGIEPALVYRDLQEQAKANGARIRFVITHSTAPVVLKGFFSRIEREIQFHKSGQLWV